MHNSKVVELRESIDDSLDKNKLLDEQFFNQINQFTIELGEENSEDLIISIFDLLNDPIVQPLLNTLSNKIKEKFSRKTEYPILARIKTCILFFFVGNGNLTQFHRTLIANQDDWGYKLGYDKHGSGYWIPAYQTIHEFFRMYLGDILYHNFDTFVKIVMGTAERYGLRPGWRSIMDSTPHESTPKDKDAKYSGHYEINGYKEHRLICADTDIPFSFIMTPATVLYDGHYAQQLIHQGLEGGAALAEIWMDQHYVTFENLPYYELKQNLKTHYRINPKWILDSSINEGEIRRIYQRMYKRDDFLLVDHCDCRLEFQLEYIWDHSKTDSHRKTVGVFLRNQYHLQQLESPKQYLQKQGVRSRIEGGFGVEKLFSILKLVIFRGNRSWKALIAIRNFIDLMIAIFRMDLGQKTKLTSWKGLVI